MIDKISDRFLRVRLEEDEHKLFMTRVTFSIIVGLLLINVIILNYILFTKFQEKPNASDQVKSLPIEAVVHSPTPVAASFTVTPAITKAAVQQTAKTDPDEFFIPLGAGSVTATDWANVPGAQAIIDFGQYPNMAKALFEASLYTPNSNQFVMVRLFNVTDNNPVWNSEMTMNTGPSALLVSNPLGVSGGAKLYQVQMKTQLNAQANLVQSRIRVINK